MFDNLFGRNMSKDIADVDKLIDEVKLPRTEPQNEHFRVGYTTDGYVTLTLMATNGYSQTMSMNPAACERLIRMLRSTYTENDYDNSSKSNDEQRN